MEAAVADSPALGPLRAGQRRRGLAEEHGTRIAIIEMGRILEDATAIHSIRSQGEAQRKAYTEDAQREAERLRQFRDELIQQQTLLAPAALEERQRAFNAEVAAADQRAKAQNQILQRAVAEGEVRFREILSTVVAELADRRSIEIVLPVHLALFAIPEFNLTDPVIERLNEDFPRDCADVRRELMPDPRFYAVTGPFTLAEIAEAVGALLTDGADPARTLSDVAPLGQAGPEHLSFLDNRKYVEAFAACRAAPASHRRRWSTAHRRTSRY